MQIKNLKEIFNGILLGVIFLLIYGYMLIGMMPYYLLAFTCLLLMLSFIRETAFKKLLIFGILFIMLSLIVSYFGDHFVISNAYIGNILMGLIIALFVIRCNFHVGVVKIVYLIIGSLLVMKMSENIGMTIYVDQEMFEGTHSSVNYVSVLMLGLLTTIYVIEFRERGTLSLWPSLFCMLVCVVSMCRSGMICAALIVFFVVYHNMKINKWAISILLLFTIIVIFYFSRNADVIDFFIGILENKKGYGYVDNPRYGLLSAYLSNIDFEKIFLGQDLRKIHSSYYFEFEGNPHNSLVLAIANWGILSFFFFYLVINAFIWFYKNNKMFGLFFAVLMLRSWFDTIFSGLIWDVFIYIFIFYPLFIGKQSKPLISCKPLCINATLK